MRYLNSSLKNLQLLAIAGIVTISALAPLKVNAQVSSINTAPTAKISFTFDDGMQSAYTQAAPTLAKYGLSGTSYVITGCVGMNYVPNTCAANTDTKYMTWQQVTGLQNSYGWEIGSHTVTHPCLAVCSGVPYVLTTQQVDYELSQSKADLAAHGINATDFATPYGDYDNNVLAQIAKYYASHRGFADQNNNNWPYNDYLINDYHVEGSTSVATVESKINDAIANKRWLVLTMHDIKVKASKNSGNYQWSTANLGQVAAYVKAKQDAGLISSVHVDQGLINDTTNLLPNGAFDSGIADGWTTDDPSAITADGNNNGSYPSPTNSIKLTSNAAGNAHLSSPKVAVDPNTTYMLKNFLNLQNISSGGIGFYVDEYDAFGNWVSGQYKATQFSATAKDMNFAYQPSSQKVASASLQVIVSGTGIAGYLDNSQWFPLSTTAPPPPSPTQTNLVPNGTFDAGIASGWTTDDPTNITADGNNNGSPNNPVNSVELVATTSNKHLFSPRVVVDSTKQYTLTSYLNMKAITSGEVGFYVDEYDTNGNWISGQYKTGVRAVGSGDTSFSYAPSSVNVKSASLQVIVVGNSGITAYVDDIRWYQN